MQGWCPLCGRLLSDVTTGARGSCSEHGRQFAEFAEPTLVVDVHDGSVLGQYVRHASPGHVGYEDPARVIGYALLSDAAIVRWGDLTTPW